MESLQSKINNQSEYFHSQQQKFQEIHARFIRYMANVNEAGGKKAVERHRKRGKLLARERIEKLTDPRTPILELSPLAGHDQYENAFPSAGIITAVGIVKGRETVMIANDATVKGGTYVRETMRKHVMIQEIAM